jgi:hypothetical protein
LADSYIREVADAIRAKTDDPSRNDLLYLVYAVLALTKGEAVTAADVHDAWSAVAEYEGTVDDDVVPFAQLRMAVRERDEPFAAAVRDVALRQRSAVTGARVCDRTNR